MSRFLIYTSPARGHLFPILGPATELADRGHRVHVRTLAAELPRVRELGLDASPIAAAVEARELNDYEARNPKEAMELGVATFCDRAPHDRDDLMEAIAAAAPEVLIVDCNSWGALVAAEASGLPWCAFQPFFSPLPSKDVPPFGPGLPLARGFFGRLRDRVLRSLLARMLDGRAMPTLNELRRREGLEPLGSMAEHLVRPPRTLYFTVDALEYPRSDWPDSYVMVGAAGWGPSEPAPDWLEAIDRPIVLATCSTERQADRALLETTLAGLASEDVFVVGTSAAEDPSGFTVGPAARVERFLPHGPIVERAVAVVCHGGMGITQRALAAGVPVCVVPFGRDQLEVARRVEHAGAGVRLLPKALTAETLRDAVRRARACAPGAERLRKAYAAAGGAGRAADVVESLLVERMAPRAAAGPVPATA